MTTEARGPSNAINRVTRGATWLLGTAIVVALVVETVGAGSIVSAVLTADPKMVAVVVVVALTILVLRGVALGILLDVLGHRVPVRRVVSAYAVTTVVSTVIPGGQAGGAPVNGLVVARAADAGYEDGVAAVVTVSALTNLVVGGFGVLGVGYLLVSTVNDNVTLLATVGVGLFGLAVLGVAGLWRLREWAIEAGVKTVTRVGRIARVVPRVSPPARETIEQRTARFGDAFGRLREAPSHQLAMLVGLLAVAHALTVVALWLSFLAVGQPVSVGVLLAVVPAAVAAAVVPTPGGIGGVDVALVGLLATGTGAVASVASAAVLVYRVATSGPALLAGGSVVVAMASLGWFRDDNGSVPAPNSD